MTHKLNLNDIVKVKLTKIGLTIYMDHIERYAPSLPLYPMRDSEGFVEFQLWDLMSIFGKRIHIGCDAPFIDNMIYIDKEVKND